MLKKNDFELGMDKKSEYNWEKTLKILRMLHLDCLASISEEHDHL